MPLLPEAPGRRPSGRALYAAGVLAVGAVVVPAGALQAQGPPLDQWAVRGITLVDGTGGAAVPDAVIIVEGGRIRCAGPAASCPLWGIPSVIDGGGLWAIPGLMDTHAHLRWSVDSTATQEEQLLRFAMGITTVREAGTHEFDANLRARGRAADPYRPEPRLVVAGNLVPQNQQAVGAADLSALADSLIGRGVDQLKIKVRLTDADLAGVSRRARRAGVPLYGHGWVGPPPTPFVDQLLSHGVAGLSHLDAFSAMAVAGVDTVPPAPDPGQDLDAWWEWRRNLWLHADTAVLADIASRLVDAGVWLEPTLARERYWGATPPPPDLLAFLVDRRRLGDRLLFREAYDMRAREASFERFGAAYERMLAFVYRFREAGGTLLAGPDVTAPGGGLHAELRLLEEAGVSPAELVEIATRHAARALGVADRYGTIEAGNVADLLLLEGDPTATSDALGQIWRVVKGGVVYDPDVLVEPVRLRVDRELAAQRRTTIERLLMVLGGLAAAAVVLVWWIRRRQAW